jgi:hypothetical protein
LQKNHITTRIIAHEQQTVPTKPPPPGFLSCSAIPRTGPDQTSAYRRDASPTAGAAVLLISSHPPLAVSPSPPRSRLSAPSYFFLLLLVRSTARSPPRAARSPPTYRTTSPTASPSHTVPLPLSLAPPNPRAIEPALRGRGRARSQIRSHRARGGSFRPGEAGYLGLSAAEAPSASTTSEIHLDVFCPVGKPPAPHLLGFGSL